MSLLLAGPSLVSYTSHLQGKYPLFPVLILESHMHAQQEIFPLIESVSELLERPCVLARHMRNCLRCDLCDAQGSSS